MADQNFTTQELESEEWLPNMQHAVGMGLKARGEALPFAIATEDVVREIRLLYKRHDPENNAVALGRRFGLHVNSVYQILKRLTWKHI